MNEHIQNIAQQIRELEKELRSAIHEQETRMLYEITGKRIKFEQAVREAHQHLKVGLFRWLGTSRPRMWLSAPFVYSLIVPVILLDICLVCYQAVCFRIFGIKRINRSDYIVIDRHQLAYLNVIEKLNCIYCGYVNGLFAFARELASLTEQYWCPIKHARKVLDSHSRYAMFTDYGDAGAYQEHLGRYQRALSQDADSD